MENGGPQTNAPDTAARSPGLPCPPPPDPNVTETTNAIADVYAERSNLPLSLDHEQWDIDAISGLGAVRMLMDALEKLAEATGDVPPTPPVSRPTTPTHQRSDARSTERLTSCRRTHQSSITDEPPALRIGSPEAHANEPITIQVGTLVADVAVQHAAIARRFFSRVAPAFSVSAYLERLHKWCPHSPAVYLAAAGYIHQLCVADRIVPATNRTVHRLSLAAIRVAAKVLEDNKWAQERYAKVGGVSNAQLLNLEVTMLFLLDFDLFVDPRILTKRMFALQQVAQHGYGVKGKLSDRFRLRPPPRKRGTSERPQTPMH